MRSPKQYKPPSAAKPAPRKTATQRGYDHRWNRYSAWRRRQIEEVLCAWCESAPTKILDHVVSAKTPGAPDFNEPTNHVGLCRCCHRAKSSLCDGVFGRAPTREGMELVARLKVIAAERWTSIQKGICNYGGDHATG